MSPDAEFHRAERTPESLIRSVLAEERRVLLMGRTGVGKSTLAAELGRALARAGRRCVLDRLDRGNQAAALASVFLDQPVPPLLGTEG